MDRFRNATEFSKRHSLAGFSLVQLKNTSQFQQLSNHHFAYIRELFDRHNKKLYDYLLAEIAEYIRLYPTSEQLVEAHYLAATLYEARGDDYEAFAAYFKVYALFPNSERQNNCKEAILRIIAQHKDLQEVQAEIANKLNETPSAG